MKAGDTVRVYPHGYPAVSAPATVLTYEETVPVLVVAFPAPPPFARAIGEVNTHPVHGIVMGLYRIRARDGSLIGPWLEVHNSGHYEIEPENNSENLAPAS